MKNGEHKKARLLDMSTQMFIELSSDFCPTNTRLLLANINQAINHNFFLQWPEYLKHC